MLGEPGDRFSLICSIGTSAICLRLKAEHLPSLQSQRQKIQIDFVQMTLRMLSLLEGLFTVCSCGAGRGWVEKWDGWDVVCGGIFSGTLSSYFSSS